MSEWQPIETAPKDGSEILLFQPRRHWSASLGLGHATSDPSGEVYTGACDAGRWSYTAAGEAYTRDDYFGDSVDPTHWMPLPAPPVLTEVAATVGEMG